ncbi:MAG: hypothetical protein Q3983_08605 [Capnocytophaga sp.]|nr:hypothetical protein [Capnocytophaga sp.]
MTFYKNKSFFATFLLVCMLKIAFPIGEFFHNHHSDKELCELHQKEKCKHSAHFSVYEKYLDCVYCQLFTTFIYLPYYFCFYTEKIIHFYGFIYKYFHFWNIFSSDRAPPIAFSL